MGKLCNATAMAAADLDTQGPVGSVPELSSLFAALGAERPPEGLPPNVPPALWAAMCRKRMEDIWEHNTSSFQDRESHLRKRHFPIPGPPKGRSLTLLEDPTGRFAVGTTGAVLWPAATALIEYLDGQVQKSCLNFRCVELGAGVGAVGLFMALHKGCEVTLTEVPEQLQLLGLNVSENSPTGLDLQVAPLTWGDQEQMEVLGTFEMVVGSDVSYRPQCIGELLSTAERLLAPGGRVVLSLQDRPGEADLLESSLKSLAVSKRESVMAKSLEGEEDVPVIIFELRRPTEMQPREAPKAAGDVEDEFFRLTGIRPDPVVIPKKEKPKEPPPEPPRPSFKERVVRDLLDRGMAEYVGDVDEETKVAKEAGYPLSVFDKPKTMLNDAAIRAAAAEDWFSTKAKPPSRGAEEEEADKTPPEETGLRKDGGTVLKCLDGLDWELMQDEASLAVNVTFSDELWFRLCGVTGYSAFKEAVSFELAEKQLRVLHAGAVVLDLQLPAPVDAKGASASVSSRKMRVAVKAQKLSETSS